jgi:hypothetical protein
VSVLDDDGEQTPVDEADDVDTCDVPWCTWTGLTNKRNGHRWIAHGLKKDDPPSKARPQKDGQGKKKDEPKIDLSASKKRPLKDRLEQSFGMIGVGVGMIDRYDGQVIVNGTPSLCTALAAWADSDEKARKYIEMLCIDAPYLQTLLVVLMILWPIAEHHKILRSTPPMIAVFKPKEDAAGGSAPAGPSMADMFAEAMRMAAADPTMMAAAMQQMGGGFAAPMTGAAPESPAAA